MMLLPRIACFIICLAIGGVLAVIAFRALASGSIKPFRMQRWSEPDDIDRASAPSAFWFWTSIHLVCSAGAIGVSILGLLGRIPLQ